MKVSISYRNGLGEVYKSDSESSVSADALSSPRKGMALAALFRVRLDLLETQGLRIDIYWYTTEVDSQTNIVPVDDFSENPIDIPAIGLSKGRIWQILDPEDLENVQSIDIDDKWHIERYDDILVNDTLFKKQREYWLGKKAEDDAMGLQVTDLHARIRQAHPTWSDAEIAASYGFPRSLWLKQVASASDQVASGERDGSGDFYRMLVDERRRFPGRSLVETLDALNSQGEIVSYNQIQALWSEASLEAGLSDDPRGERIIEEEAVDVLPDERDIEMADKYDFGDIDIL